MKKGIIASVAFALVGGVLMIPEGVFQPKHLAYSWHAAATFGLTLTLGGFFVGAVLVNSGAKWSATLRRVHSAIGGALPVACLAFIPILHVSDEVVLDIAYLCVAVAFEEVFRAAQIQEKKRAGIGAVGLVVVSLLMTIFFFDVTLAPSRPWVSDMFGLYVLVGSFGAGVGATAFVGALAADTFQVTQGQSSAWGRVELVATCLWGYCAFSLYMLIWVADMPREVAFFVPRTAYAWGWMSTFLVFGRFVVPFMMLVPRAPKQHWWHVGAMGALIVVVHALDCEMMVGPSGASAPSWLDFGSFFVVGGVLSLVSMLRFRRHAPLPAAREVEVALAYEGS